MTEPTFDAETTETPMTLFEALTFARTYVEKWCHYQGDSKALFDQYLKPIDAALNAGGGEGTNLEGPPDHTEEIVEAIAKTLVTNYMLSAETGIKRWENQARAVLDRLKQDDLRGKVRGE